VKKDQRIKESTLSCPNKRLRRHLWVVLGGYRWRRSRLVSHYRAHLPIVFCPSGDSNTLQRYTNFVYNLYLIQLSHIQDHFGVLDEYFLIYTLITSIKSQQFPPHSMSPKFICFIWQQVNDVCIAPLHSKINLD
jgi:hypothetical protein